MKVKAISWVGVSTDTPDVMAGFFRDVLKLPVAVDEPSFAVFELPSGDKVEVFGPDAPAPDYQFASNPVVVGFLVDDIDAATAALREAGVEVLGDKETAGDDYAWQHFRGPDGRIYELTYDATRD